MNGQSGSLTNGFTYVVAPTVSSVSPNSGTDGGWNGGDDHGDELCGGSDGEVRSDGSDERSGGEQHIDYGDDAGRNSRRGDGDGDGGRAEWESGQRIYLCSCADGEQCESEQRSRGGWDGGDDHGDELRGRSDGDVRSDGGDERGGGEQHIDHGDDTGRKCGAVTVTVTNSNGQSGSLTNGFTYAAAPTVSSVSPNSGIDGGRNGGNDHGDELCGGSDGEVRSDGSDQCSGGEQHINYGDDSGRNMQAR